MKRILSFVLALCLIVGLLPAVTLQAYAATEATVTLWGTPVTATTETAYYWTNNGTSAPAESTADAEWNYSFAILDGVPTVTVRNADFQYSARFLYTSSSYTGRLNLVYEGTNNFKVPNASGKQFAYVQGVKENTTFSIIGNESAQLNITGGYKDGNLLQVSTSNSTFYIRGGEINITRTTSGKYGVIGSTYAHAVIEDCTLNVKNNYANAYICMPAVYLGGGGYDCTIRNSDVTINAENIIGLCVGIPATTSKVSATNDLIIEGNSNVVINEYRNDDAASKTYTGGIYAANVIVKGGNLEVSGRDNAFTITNTSANGPDLSQYDGEYQMYTAVDGEAVTEYTQTAYFKLAEVVPCAHENTTETAEITQDATCGEVGSMTVTVSCSDCGEIVSTREETIPATNEHNYDETTGICSGCGDVEVPIEGPTWPEDVTFATAEQMANVVLEKKASAGGAMTAHPGGKITYKLSITNNNAETINVHVEDMIPKDTQLLNGCDYTSGRALYWVEENIAPGETRVITYNVKPDYTVAEVRASEFDIILENEEAKVMDVTVPSVLEDIYVLETFNAGDIRKLEMAIDALVTAYQPKLNEIKLLNMIFNVGFTAGPGLGTTDPNAVLEMIFDKAGENVGGSTGSGEDAVDTALNLLDRVPPHLYGGTEVAAEKDELFRGERATEVTINDLVSGDLLFVKNNDETKLYIVDNSCLVHLGKTEVTRKIDPATVLPGLPASQQFVVIRPSINYNITFALQEGEYYNDADREGYTEVEKAIIATAEAYLLRGDRAQYTDDMTGTSLYRWETGTKQPEYYTVDQYGYTNCAAFTYDANYMTTGYAAKNGNYTLNTTANNAAFAKKYWDFETGTSSNPGVVYYAEPMVKDDSGTYVETLTEEEKAAMKAEIISLLRPGDIINIRRTTGSGHAMLYVGNGTIIHSGGASYSNDNKADTHEATCRFRMVEDLFDPSIYATTSCVYYLASFALVRPSAMTTKGANEHALNRMNNMQGIIAEKISSTAMGKTVNCGDEITYTFYVFNTNAEDKVIAINDVVSEYATFVSATDGGTCVDGNVAWNITVPADTRMSVSYTVKVNDGLAHYTAIDGSKATINGVAHKCFDTYVANTLTATEQQTVVDAVEAVKSMDLTGLTNVQIAELIYKEAFGIEHIFGGKVTTGRELAGGDTDNNYSTKGIDNMGVFNDTWYWESSNKTSVSWMPNHNTSAAAQMVAPGLYGGQLVYQSSYNKNNRDERQNRYLNMVDGTLRSRYFWEKDLVVGDIFMMGSSSSVYLFVYVGDNTFVNIAASGFTNYTVTERFEYAPAYAWKYLAVMRPSFVFEEAHNVVEIPAVESTCTAAGATAGKECADCGVHLVEPLTVDALAHTEEVVPGKAATCTETGLTDGAVCTVCGETTVAQEEIAALGHTEDTVAGKAATCTETGLTDGAVCSVCGETVTAQEEIPALGHTYADDAATECAVCGAVRATITVVDDEVFVSANGMTDIKVHAFNITDKEVADINVWADLKAADPDFATYTKNPFELANGAYVLRVEYTDAEGNDQAVSYQVTINYTPAPVTPPTIEVNGNAVSVNTNGLTGVVVHAFNVADKTVADINAWNDLKAADPDFKTYAKDAFVLENGVYVLRVQYSNADGDMYAESYAYTIDYTPVAPTAAVSGKTVTVSGATVTKVHVFCVEGKGIADTDDWSQLKAADSAFRSYAKAQVDVKNSGAYVLRIEYVDDTGVARAASQTITVA